ncbi:MAG TPA: L-threonylcarbamoyladenylate synthase [Clostridia bacterium]
METLIKKPDEEALALAKEIITSGGLVAFKTETVYGLGADIYNEQAVRNIFQVKGRPADNPLIVHLADKSEIKRIVKSVPPLAQKLIDIFMPGPLTLILERAESVPAVVSAGLPTVAVRVPVDETANKFLKAVGAPIAAPSANTSSRPSPTTAMDVYEDLKGKIPLILDGGQCEVGLESTVIDARGDLTILRHGGITKEKIEDILKVKIKEDTSPKDKPISPGTKYRHYAPNAKMYFVSYGKPEEVERLYNENKHLRTVVLALDKYLPAPKEYQNFYSLGKDEVDAAHNLFRALRELEKQYDVIIAYACREEGLGVSVNSRMRKAAGNNII